MGLRLVEVNGLGDEPREVYFQPRLLQPVMVTPI